MVQIFPIDFEEKLTMAQDDYILFSDSEDGNKIKKAQYKNLKGEKGDPGTPGADGQDGAAATITVGSVSTLPAGSSATVTNSGTSSAAVLNFGIPEGATGAAGADGKDGTDGKDGKDGTDGAAATITVGTTTTLPAGSSATVTNVGTSQDAILNFGIPKGDSGTGSGDVNGPASSTDGHLAVFDGATGKIIKDGGAIPEGNVKSFTLSSTSDLINAQAAYDWWVAGKNPIISYQDRNYILDGGSSSYIIFKTTLSDNIFASSSNTIISGRQLTFYLSNGTVSSISIATISDSVLLTDKNYSTPYTPAYDGSPATKKYVDDKKSTISVTLTSAGWSSSTQTVTATGVTASNTVIVSPSPSDYSDYTDAEIYCSAQGSGTLTFTCGTTPSNDIDVNVVILN